MLLLFSHQITTSYWPVLPFGILLVLIATGGVLFQKFWHESYKVVSVSLGLVVAFWYIYTFKQTEIVLETFSEYVSFIALLFALFAASGGIHIDTDFEPNGRANILFLLSGALLTNIIGTTGASVLLIRPFMKMNGSRLKPYHIIFFIFIISNSGGLLTPIGDPPLFLGFLKGIPFFYPFTHFFFAWLVCMLLLLFAFYLFERRNLNSTEEIKLLYTNTVSITGKRNIFWLIVIILSVFLDPKLFPFIPAITFNGHSFSFIREIIQITSALMCLRHANKDALELNKFSFEPMMEIVFLFFGIFMTMIPALQLLQKLGADGMHLTLSQSYFATGLASGFLDNAPAYLNFLTLSMSSSGLSIHHSGDVSSFLSGPGSSYIAAISIASVLWGALSYIGNGPNFLVKTIAEHSGVKMPSFFGYICRYSLPVLVPVLIVIWLVFIL